MSEVLVIGEALVDAVKGPDGSPRGEHPGGSPANVAVGLARLDHPTTLLTHLAEDAYGRLVIDHLEKSGVRLAPGSLDAARTPSATAHLSASGAAEYEFDLGWSLPDGDIAALLEGAGNAVDAVHTGSIGAILTPGADRVEAIWRTAAIQPPRHAPVLSFDPNVRPSIIGDDSMGARARISRFVASSHVVKVSDEDLRWLDTRCAPEDVAERWLASGPALVVVTRGGDGASAWCAAGRVDVPAPLITVVDTVGAGDSFMSGLLDGLAAHDLLARGAQQALHDIDLATVTAVVEHAVLISAMTCERAGAQPPTRADLDARAH